MKCHLNKAKSYLQSLEMVKFAYLFGSMASGRTGPMSDVDIAVYLDDDAVQPDTRLEILGQLMDIFETDEIDLVVLNRAALSLRMSAIKNRIVLTNNKPFERHLFESKTMREYFDFSRFEKNILTRRYLNG